MNHRVLLQVPNPFVKRYPFQASKPCFVHVWKEDMHCGWTKEGTRFGVIFYGLKGHVKAIFKLELLTRPRV